MITLGNIIATNAPCELNLTTLLETRMLVQANSGGGKSYALRRLLEQTAPSVQQLVIDPEGEFASLREKFDYVIAAPQDGDALATPQTATLLARRLLESGVSAILNIYELKAHERVLFVRRFLEALVNAPKSLWHPVLIALDEAHVFAPQVGSAESLQAVSDIATRGRKRGQCLIAATQRLSKLHKDVAAELGNKMIGRTGLDVDVKRAADELGFSSRDATEGLRNLNAGEFFVFGPALTRAVEKIKVGQVRTTHPKAGHRLLEAPPAPSAKLRAQLAKLSDLQKDAEAEVKTLDDLRKENARLKQELKRVGSVDESALRTSIRASFAQEFSKRERDARLAIENIKSCANRLVHDVNEIIGVTLIMRDTPGSHATISPRREAPIVQPPSRDSRGARPAAADASAAGATGLPKGEQIVLTAVAQHPDGVTREQLTVLTGYKRSTRDAYIQRMRERGVIEMQGERIHATEAGVAALGSDFTPLPTGSALADHWLEKLPEGESRILRILIESPLRWVAREKISELTNYARSSRDAYLQRLKARQLIRVDRGLVAVSENLS